MESSLSGWYGRFPYIVLALLSSLLIAECVLRCLNLKNYDKVHRAECLKRVMTLCKDINCATLLFMHLVAQLGIGSTAS